MKKIIILLFLSLICLSGCGTQYAGITPEELSAAEIGLPPTDREKTIRENTVTFFIDHTSLQLIFNTPPKRAGVVMRDNSRLFGWGGIVQVNAKNRMGGYVGFKPYGYIINDDKLLWFNNWSQYILFYIDEE